MLSCHPRFKGRKQQVRRNATQDSAEEQDIEVARVFQAIDNDFQYTVYDAGVLAAKFVNRRPEERGEDGPTQKSC